MDKVMVFKNGAKEYYIMVVNQNGASQLLDDDEISKYLKMTRRQYRFTLKSNYNGYSMFPHGDTYFRTKIEAEKAAEWIDSILVAFKLGGITNV